MGPDRLGTAPSPVTVLTWDLTKGYVYSYYKYNTTGTEWWAVSNLWGLTANIEAATSSNHVSQGLIIIVGVPPKSILTM